MAEPFLGQIAMVSFNFAPKGYALCNGQTLSIQQNTALFSLLGTTYGGNGTTTFNLPNLQGATPLHVCNGFALGQAGGEAAHTLILSEMPTHSHQLQGDSAVATTPAATGNIWGSSTANPFSNVAPNTTMNPTAIGFAGGSQPHDNFQPYLVINFVIALVGIFPTRN
jgi:microcystin-dependent protein